MVFSHISFGGPLHPAVRDLNIHKTVKPSSFIPQAMADSYGFEFCSEEVLNDFAGLGLQKLAERLQSPTDLGDAFTTEASCIFTELLMAVEEQLIDANGAVEFLKLVLSNSDVAKIFCSVCDVYPSIEIVTRLLQLLPKDETCLSPKTMAENIDSAILIKIGLLPADTYNRQLNTKKRDFFYTQKKFNLFHEEFDGYSLVINELQTILSSENNISKVDYAVDVINKLMGHYLLDPNRVLDLLLDIFSNYLVGNHKFIILFLQKSLWWPNKVANCFDGFKEFHSGGCSAASHSIVLQMKKFPGTEFPETFISFVTILVKVGFISFGSIYSHVPPGEEAMSLLKEKYQKDLESEVFRASANALALAAPLKDDDIEGENPSGEDASAASKNTEEQTTEYLAKHNIKLQMLRCFLSNGLYWPSIYVLSQYPFLAHVDKEVGELMNRLFAALIKPMYQGISTLSTSELRDLPKKHLVSAMNLGKLSVEEPTPIVQYCFKPTIKSHFTKQYVYFFDEWAHQLPICTTRVQLLEVSNQFLKFFGPILTQDHGNFIQLCEIIAHDLKQDPIEDNREIWFSYFRNYIFPYIGWIKNNTVAIDKAYSILELYTTEDRFNLYGELNQVLAKNNSYVKISFGKAEKATKDTLKRLSKENVAQMMRQLARISVSNPLPCFLTIIQQIESYDNLNSLVVETASHFSRYGWDNMTLALLMRLSASGRSNLLGNGLNDRRWIQSLASFIGALCAKYPTKMDLKTLILYIVKSLHAKDNSQLLVLKEIISCMGGFQAITNLTQLQVDMISCGSDLAKIVFRTIGDLRYDSTKSGTQLTETLLEDSHGSELIVLLSQLEQQILSDESMSHLKVLAVRKDEISAALHLTCSLLSFFSDSSPKLVTLQDLLNKYNVSVPWAFEVWRKFLPLESQMPPKVFSSPVNSDLFYSFWKLELYDINYSAELYDSELDKLRSNLFQQNEELSFLLSSKTDTSTLSPIKANIARLEATIAKIPQLKTTHENHCAQVLEFLKKKGAEWFTKGETRKADIQNLLQDCILPRATHSCFDAMLSAKFLFKLQSIELENFSILECLSQLFMSKILFSTLFTSTPTEAENLGIFLSVILQELDKWRNEEVFASIKTLSLEGSDNTEKTISFSQFKHVLFDFHKIILEDISRALRVTSYMSRINAITFLKNLLNIYPIVEDHCEDITLLIEDVSKYDIRDDLKLSSAALIGHVRSREHRWVHMWDFYDMDDDNKAQQKERRESLAKEKMAILAKAQKLKEAEVRENEAKKEKEKAETKERMLRALNSQASASSLNYSDKGGNSTIPIDRIKNQAERGRYDNYSGNNKVAPVTTSDKVKSSVPSKSGSQSYNVTPRVPTPSQPSAARKEESTDLFSKKLNEKVPEGPSSENSGRNSYRPSSKPAPNTRQEAANTSSNSNQTRQRAPLPPQRVPDRDSRYTRNSTVPSRGSSQSQSQSTASSKRTPLPPQGASAPQSRSGEGSRNARQSQYPRERESGNGNGSNGSSNSRVKQQSTRSGAQEQSRGSSSQASSYNTSLRDRAANDSRRLPAKPGPLPPPSLPPPRPSQSQGDGRQNKRPYEDNYGRRDKRRR